MQAALYLCTRSTPAKQTLACDGKAACVLYTMYDLSMPTWRNKALRLGMAKRSCWDVVHDRGL